jgi:hypothetical protein
LKEKPRHRFQLLGGFKQESAARTLLALLVSLNFLWVDPQPGSELCLESPQKFRLTAMHFPILTAKSRSKAGDNVAASCNSCVKNPAFWD